MSVNLFEKTKRRKEKFGLTNQQTCMFFPGLGLGFFVCGKKILFSPIYTVLKQVPTYVIVSTYLGTYVREVHTQVHRRQVRRYLGMYQVRSMYCTVKNSQVRYLGTQVPYLPIPNKKYVPLHSITYLQVGRYYPIIFGLFQSRPRAP